MKGIVSLKGNKYGLSVIIAEDAPFEEIKEKTAEYFKSAKKMFGKEKVAIGFEGRVLTDAERDELVEVIENSCSLKIVCVMDFNSGTEEIFRKAVERYGSVQNVEPAPVNDTPIAEVPPEIPAPAEEAYVPEEQIESESEPVTVDENGFKHISAYPAEYGDVTKMARFYKGNLRNGLVIADEASLVILGDINPGAEVYSGGNIIVLGSLKGKAYAGIHGNEDAFVYALNMDPIQIRIGDKIGRSSDTSKVKKEKTHEQGPKIAMVRDNAIAIELVSRSVLNEIKV